MTVKKSPEFQGGKFIVAAQEIAFSEKLSYKGRLIYIALCSFADRNTRQCFPPLGDLVTATGMGLSTVKRGLKELVSQGFVEYRERTGPNGSSSHLYTLNDCAVDEGTGGFTANGGRSEGTGVHSERGSSLNGGGFTQNGRGVQRERGPRSEGTGGGFTADAEQDQENNTRGHDQEQDQVTLSRASRSTPALSAAPDPVDGHCGGSDAPGLNFGSLAKVADPKPVRNTRAYSPEFEAAWASYQRKGSKPKSFVEWAKALKRVDDPKVITDAIGPYVVATPEIRFRKDFERFLSGDLWESAIAGPSGGPGAANGHAIGTRHQAGDVSRYERAAVALKQKDGTQ